MPTVTGTIISWMYNFLKPILVLWVNPNHLWLLAVFFLPRVLLKNVAHLGKNQTSKLMNLRRILPLNNKWIMQCAVTSLKIASVKQREISWKIPDLKIKIFHLWIVCYSAQSNAHYQMLVKNVVLLFIQLFLLSLWIEVRLLIWVDHNNLKVCKNTL